MEGVEHAKGLQVVFAEEGVDIPVLFHQVHGGAEACFGAEVAHVQTALDKVDAVAFQRIHKALEPVFSRGIGDARSHIGRTPAASLHQQLGGVTGGVVVIDQDAAHMAVVFGKKIAVEDDGGLIAAAYELFVLLIVGGNIR